MNKLQQKCQERQHSNSQAISILRRNATQYGVSKRPEPTAIFFPEFSLQDRDSMEDQTDDECINPSYATFLHYPQSPDTIFKTMSRSGSAPASFFCGSPLCTGNVVTTTVAPLSLSIVSSTTAPAMKCLY